MLFSENLVANFIINEENIVFVGLNLFNLVTFVFYSSAYRIAS